MRAQQGGKHVHHTAGGRVFLLFALLAVASAFTASCVNSGYEITYAVGRLPDTVSNLRSVNSPFDDMNVGPTPAFRNSLALLFSTNRYGEGRSFDLYRTYVYFRFIRTDGDFRCTGSIPQRCNSIINSDTDEYGPIVVDSGWSGNSGLPADETPEGLHGHAFDKRWIVSLSRASTRGDLDVLVSTTLSLDEMVESESKPTDLRLAAAINSESNDCYFALGANRTAYFCSDREGKYSVYSVQLPSGAGGAQVTSFLCDSTNSTAVSRLDAVSSGADDKCPFILDTVMVFVSDRPGGYGGLDIWVSVWEEAAWQQPYNLGEAVNTPSNEYRPAVVELQDFDTNLLLFSSDRAGGEGGYDIYYAKF